MKFVLRLLLVLLPFALVSCSYFSKSSFSANRDKGYLMARSIPPLRIPPGVKNDSFHTKYPVSDRNYPVNAVSVVPPGLYNK